MINSRNLLLIFALLLAFPSIGQSVLSQRIHLEHKDYSIDDLLVQLRREGLNLAYSSDILPKESIAFSSHTYTVKGILDRLQQEIGIKYKVVKETIMLNYEQILYTLSGHIRDAQSGEALIGAEIVVDDGFFGTITNSYGFYSLTLKADEYKISFRYIGYGTIQETIDLKANTQFMVGLNENSAQLEEVTISGNNPKYNIENMVPGVNPINFGKEWPIPYFLGEEDIFQNSLTHPGIRSIGEDATGLNIRGGDVDQNLILLDESPIYNPNHFYGLISVFSPEVVNNVEIMKGHIPARYGGRASSVISVIQREGNNQEFHASGGIGLVSARLALEGPIKKDVASYLISARRSLINFSIADFLNATLDESRTSFQDFNAKINWTVNPKNRIYLSTYIGRDRNRTGFNAIRKWGNRSVSMRWNKVINPRLFSNFTGVVSEYNYQIKDPQEVGSFIGKSLVRDLSIKTDFGYIINPSNTIDFGVQSTMHRLKPGERLPLNENSSTNGDTLDIEDALETAFYFSHKSEISERISIQYGLRMSFLQNFGPGEIYVYDANVPKSDLSIIDTVSIAPNNIYNHEMGWEPKFAINFKLNDYQSIKGSYSKSYQFIHLISNTVSPSPTDIWKMTDRNIKPTISAHYSLGFYNNPKNQRWETSVEMYYKHVNNIIEFKDGADLLFNENIETELLNGVGRSYGFEIFIKRNSGRLKGWVSYTLSNTEQQYNGITQATSINDGAYFPTDFDKRHDINLTGVYEISERISVSGSFNYNSGRPLTLPVGKYIFDGKIVPHFENRNLDRLPEYHRLDLGLRLKGKGIRKSGIARKNNDSWVFTVYNVYARQNTFSYFFKESDTSPGQTEVIPYSIFRTPIPSVTYNFKF